MRILALVFFLLVCCTLGYADTWVASDGGTADRNITFTFENGVLTVNRTSYGWSGGVWPGAYSYSFSLGYDYSTRPWFRCLDSLGNPDPYATFVETAGFTGHMSWASNTPAGYQTTLKLGGPGLYSPNLYVLYHYVGGMGGDYTETCPIGIEHTFTATYPEPSALAVVALALLGMVGFHKRK